MGQPKLLLPWGNWTLIDQLLQAWTSSAVDQIVVVVREDDRKLIAACRKWPVHLVKPRSAPRDMKESVQIGLRFVEEHWRPTDEDRCFIAPADLPGLTSTIINRLIETKGDCSTVTIPKFGNRPGHPALLPWPVTQQIFDLADDQGVNQVVDTNPQYAVPFPADAYLPDVDTPQEYRSLLTEQKRSNNED
jgi:CTP:molybdopterin cytidylyltransferase MocA